MSESRIADQEKDIEELKTLISQCTRTNVKQVLNADLAKMELDLDKLKAAHAAKLQAQAMSGCYVKKIESYGWDQTSSVLKLYITSLKDLDKVNKDEIFCTFTNNSFDLLIKNLNGTNYNLNIVLSDKIVPEESSYKVKSDMIALSMKKASLGNWAYLSQLEAQTKRKQEQRKPQVDQEADPQDNIMKMMKQMYEDGDDEMKRTITKAFAESREKQLRGGEGEFNL